MERELWPELARAVREVDAGWKDAPRYTHRTADVVRVHLWSALHDRPTSWACDARNWPGPPTRILPDQSTVSRRKRKRDFEAFLDAVGERLAGRGPSAALVKRLDGKPLAAGPGAQHGPRRALGPRRGAQSANGYKLHALWADRAMPEQWAVAPRRWTSASGAWRAGSRRG
jgi:hypothetical protein